MGLGAGRHAPGPGCAILGFLFLSRVLRMVLGMVGSSLPKCQSQDERPSSWHGRGFPYPPCLDSCYQWSYCPDLGQSRPPPVLLQNYLRPSVQGLSACSPQESPLPPVCCLLGMRTLRLRVGRPGDSSGTPVMALPPALKGHISQAPARGVRQRWGSRPSYQAGI